MLKVLRVAVGIEGGRKTTTEGFQLEECIKTPIEIAFEYVQISKATQKCSRCEIIIRQDHFGLNLYTTRSP